MGKIQGFDCTYEVSDTGVVKNMKTGRVKKPTMDSDGYFRVTLHKAGKPKCLRIHRLVAMAYIPNPENFDTVNHKNGIKTDNRVENLEWASNAANIKHAHDNLLINKKGENNNWAILNACDVEFILTSNEKSPVLAIRFGVDESTIRKVRQRRTWKHLTF